MKKTVIKIRFLKKDEIASLTEDVKHFPDLVYVSERVWRKRKAHVLEIGNRFAGVVVVYRFNGWVKLGPLVVLGKYQGKGLGKKLLKHAIDRYKKSNILITSTNPKVGRIASLHGFKEMGGLLSLPLVVKLFLLKQFLEYLGIKTVFEALRKRLAGRRGKRLYFIRFSP